MLKRILNFEKVEVLSALEQKEMVEQTQRCGVEHSLYSYDGSCMKRPPTRIEKRICKITIDGVFCE